ncbi:MAG: retropepsin-like aspartic protease [Terracidiphilus sp.]
MSRGARRSGGHNAGAIECRLLAGLALAIAAAGVLAPSAAQEPAQSTAERSAAPAAPEQAAPPAAGQAAPAPPASEFPAGAPAQQPGEDAQLRTGTASGLTTDARLRNLLADHRYASVEGQLGQLSAEQAQFYRGILANRDNNPGQSIQLLEPLVGKVSAGGDADEEKLLRETLAEDYLREGDWAKAGEAYQALDSRLHARLSADELDEIEMPLKLLPLAKNDPPATADPCEPFRLQVSINPLGLIDVPVFVDARSRTWMLDPTAPFNLIARSTAKEAGLNVSAESATIHTLTGRPIPVHVTVIPRLTIGGRLTLHNVTAFVFEDADYAFPHAGYKVEGVLGYPALAAMGSLTVGDNAIEVRPAKEIAAGNADDRLTTGARFYLDGDRIIVALGRAQEAGADSAAQDASGGGGGQAANDDRMFEIDAGGQQTYLTSRWFDEHAAEFNSQKMESVSFPGMGTEAQSAYVAETVPLAVGGTTIRLHYIPVLPRPVGGAAHDDVYGVLGIDALDQLKSYTFDYRTMRFSASTE